MTNWGEALKKQARSAARETVEETARKLAARAASLTPVKTGKLKAGWQVVDDPGQGEDRAGDGAGTGGSGDNRRYVVNLTSYAQAVELGTLGRPGRCMAQQAMDQAAGGMSELFVSKMNHRIETTGGDDFESVNQSAEPEEILGDASGVDP